MLSDAHNVMLSEAKHLGRRARVNARRFFAALRMTEAALRMTKAHKKTER